MPFFTRLQPSKGSDDEDDDSHLDDFDEEMQVSPPASGDSPFLLRIKSRSDCTVTVHPGETVAALKQKILRTLQQPRSSYVRLICSGRLLTPNDAPLSDFVSVTPNSVVHAVIADEAPRTGAQASLLRGTLRRGAGIDASGRAVRESPHEDSDSDDSDTERLGLERLRDTIGFRRSEIASVRSYFQPSIDRWIREHPQSAAVLNENDPMRRRLLQEDAWMQAQGPNSEFRVNLGHTSPNAAITHRWRASMVGTDRDFVWGFMLGYFVGYIMLLWVWLPTVPHKHKIGILSGVCLRIFMRMQNQPTESEGMDALLLTDYR